MFYVERFVDGKALVIDTNDYSGELYTDTELFEIAKTVSIVGVDLKNRDIDIASTESLFGIAMAKDRLCCVDSKYEWSTTEEISNGCDYRAFELSLRLRGSMTYKVPDGVRLLKRVTNTQKEVPYTIVLPRSVKAICYDCFKDEYVRSINLENIESISEDAFKGCKSLTEITISPCLSEVYRSPFTDSALRVVNLSGDISRIAGDDITEWFSGVGHEVQIRSNGKVIFCVGK